MQTFKNEHRHNFTTQHPTPKYKKLLHGQNMTADKNHLII